MVVNSGLEVVYKLLIMMDWFIYIIYIYNYIYNYIYILDG